jgi:predicted permease
MLGVLVQTLPFFAVIGLGFLAGRTGFFSPAATADLTRFVFYFALSAMLFRLSAKLTLSEVIDGRLVAAYLAGTGAVYLLAVAVAAARRLSLAETAVEAQVAAIGNTGFLGIPMLTLLLGPAAIGPVMLVLAADLIVFGSLIVILITLGRERRITLAALLPVARGLVANPMIVSIALGFLVSGLALPVPAPVNDTLALLGAAATPGALFAIGASLATKSAERLQVALWLSACKLVLHPLAVAAAALWLIPAASFDAGVAIAAAAMPVAGNIFILAQHYRVAPQRVSASILISTAASVITVPLVIALIAPLVAG